MIEYYLDSVLIIKERNKRNISQKELAKNIGVVPSTIFKIESGFTKNPQMKIIANIAKFFDVPIEFFIKSTI